MMTLKTAKQHCLKNQNVEANQVIIQSNIKVSGSHKIYRKFYIPVLIANVICRAIEVEVLLQLLKKSSVFVLLVGGEGQ